MSCKRDGTEHHCEPTIEPEELVDTLSTNNVDRTHELVLEMTNEGE